ncbi:MAG: hypothetical protein Q8R02_00100 [Hyphomonadaceae bacterium]|nr:hypothetical protein [Hyphomonadaceae bacterium]
MTVIAAVSLFDGVMLQADCRVTVSGGGGGVRHCDIAQKIFFLTPSLAIAFSGDVFAAAVLIPELRRQLRSRRHLDTESLLRWIPRFLRAGYAKLRSPKRRPGQLNFIIAGANHGRENVVERARIVEIMNKIARGQGVMQRSWIPSVLVTSLMTPASVSHVTIPGTVTPILAYAQSPGFFLHRVPPLSAVAIGTGGGAVVEMEKASDWLFAAGDDHMTRMGLEWIVSDFAIDNGIETVGGMFPAIKLDKRGLTPLGSQVDLPTVSVSVDFDWATKRWVQRNLTTGRELRLLRPEELVKSLPRASQRFDDYTEAWKKFSSRPTQV